MLEGALPEPRRRTAGWLSSTFGPSSTDPDAQTCSAAYHVRVHTARICTAAGYSEGACLLMQPQLGPLLWRNAGAAAGTCQHTLVIFKGYLSP